jgi:endoglucanase
MDARTIQSPRLVAHLMSTADAGNIPYQVRRPGGGGTNTGAIQRAGVGIPAATLAVPGRYAHTPTMMINLDDYANLVRLADAALRGLTPDVIRRGQAAIPGEIDRYERPDPHACRSLWPVRF